MGLTAFADGEKSYAAYDVTTETNKTKGGNALTALQVTFNERKWYIIEDNSSSATSGTVTLLSADTTFGTKTFDNNENSSDKYSTSQVKAYLDSMTGTDGAFADVAEAIETVNLTTNKFDSTDVYETVNGVKLYLLSVEEAVSLPENVRKAGFTGGDCQFNEWWLRSPGYSDTYESDAVYVWGDDGVVCADGASVNNSFGVRPALQLDLSKVEFDSSSKSFAMAKSAYADLKNTTTVITFDNKQWYLIEDNSTSATEGTVTLLSKECVGASIFGGSSTYSGSTVEGVVNNYYTNSISTDAKTVVSGNGMFLLTTDQANAIKTANVDVLKCSKATGAESILWWLGSPCDSSNAACVYGDDGSIRDSGEYVERTLGVRPALKLDLSKVEFDSSSKTFAVVKSAYADYLPAATDDATALAAKVVKFNGYNWYLIEDNSTSETAGTVTLFAADDGFGLSKFSDSYSNAYSSSKIRAALEAMTAEDGDFANVASAIVSTALEDVTVPRAKLYLLSTSEAQNLNQTILNYDFPDSASKGAWWLRSPGTNSDYASCVYGDEGRIDGTGYNIREACGVRPALKLDLSKAEFDSETKTFAVPNSGAYAGYVPAEADDATALAAKVVKFNGHDWYLIEDNSKSKTKGTVTLFAKECVGASKFDSNGSSNTYSGSTLESYVNNWSANNISTDAKSAVSGDVFLLTTDQAQAITNTDVLKCSQASGAAGNYWWLCSPGIVDYTLACVDGENGDMTYGGNDVNDVFGVRPALKLDLSKVEFDSETKTFAVPTPGAYADYVPAEADNATALAAKVVKFNGYDWYLIKDKSTSETEGTVTLFAKDFIGNSKFDDSSDKYSESAVKEYLDNLTNAEGTFAGVADAIKTVETLTTKGYNSDDVYDTVSNVKLYLLSTSEAYKLPVNVRKCGYSGYWWLRSPGKRIDNDDFDMHTASAALVDGYDYNNGEVYEEEGPVAWELGVRPALRLDLSQVTFASVNLSGGANASSSGDSSIKNTFFKTVPEMTTITYTANEGYMFPVESNSYGTSDGITVTRTSDTCVTVSGTPTGVVNVTIPDAVLAHTHDFNYSADGATITATCTADGCPLTDSKATLTIAAPDNLTYDKSAKAAVITDANAIQGTAKVQYQTKNGDAYGEATETAPTNAGTYKASITVGGATASVEYTIAKADPTCTAPTGLTATYGQTLADVTLTNPSGNTAGTWAWSDSRTSVGNAGTNTFKASFVPTDTTNYNTKTNIDVSVSVGKADPTANDFIFSEPDNLNYDGNNKMATVIPQDGVDGMGNATVKYYSDAARTNEVDYAKNADTYYVGITVNEGDNYNATSAVLYDSSWKFTVAKANPTADDFTFSEPDNLNYDGNNKMATVIPQDGVDGMGNATVKYYSDAARTNEVDYAKNADTYYVGITVNEGDNYNAASAVLYDSSWKFTVAKANQTAPAAPTEAGKTINSITLNEIPNGEYKCGAGDWQTSPTFTGLDQNKSYVFRQRYAADANHNASAGSEETVIYTANHTHSFTYTKEGMSIVATCSGEGICSLSNNKVSFTLVPPTENLVYDGTDKLATLEGVDAFNAATGMNVSANDIVYNYKAKSSDSAVVVTETKNAGTYQVLYTLQTDFPRPVLTSGFTISKANPTCTAPTGLTATYGQTLADVTLTNPSGNTAGTWAWADSRTSVGNVGTNTFKASFVPTDTTNYNTKTDIDISVTVGKANITPTVSLDGWIYGQEANAPSVSGNTGNGAVTYTYATKGSDEFSETVPTNAGTYTVKAVIAATTNYNGATATADFTIAKADIAPTVSLDGWTYGDEANLPTVTGNTENGDVTYLYKEKGASDMSCTDEVPTQAGEYTVKALIAETANYNGANAEADFTIAKAKVTITADDKSSKREANLKKLTYKVDGKIYDGDDLGIKVSSNVKAAVAGKYVIKVAYIANANYDVTVVNGTYTVTDRITAKERTAGKNKINSAIKATVNKNGSVTAKWGAVANAERYEVYANYCSKDNEFKKIKTVKGNVHSFDITKLGGKKLDQKKPVKIYVVAYRKVNGKYEKITQSVQLHVVNQSKNYSNAKAITVKKDEFTLGVNKTAAIKPTLVLKNSKKKAVEHVAKFRYQSTNKAVATVDKNGKIKAVGKGTCTIYIFANNGKLKSVKVTVK